MLQFNFYVVLCISTIRVQKYVHTHIRHIVSFELCNLKGLCNLLNSFLIGLNYVTKEKETVFLCRKEYYESVN